ncbi:hypothetical protein VAE122_90001 [Vibrio aestuarianus]|nr:hypothetical protein VAE122_90001 [Vibrio aestuarianus]
MYHITLTSSDITYIVESLFICILFGCFSPAGIRAPYVLLWLPLLIAR